MSNPDFSFFFEKVKTKNVVLLVNEDNQVTVAPHRSGLMVTTHIGDYPERYCLSFYIRMTLEQFEDAYFSGDMSVTINADRWDAEKDDEGRPFRLYRAKYESINKALGKATH